MKKPTISDIAKIAGVSKTTVSLVLNNRNINVSEKTRSKIIEISNELNYIPNGIARSLSTSRTETIGIILPDIVNPFFSEIARAIEDTAGKLNYNVILCNSDSNNIKEEKYTKLLISKLVAGTIFISGGGSRNSIDFFKKNNIPVVFVDRYVDPLKDFSGVFCSNEEGIFEAIKYLYDKGKRNIGFVNGSMKLETSKLRLKAFDKISKQLDIYSKSLIYNSIYSVEGGLIGTENLLNSNPKIDAILYSSDVMAFGGIKTIKRKNLKIPEDISVIGYDDISFCEYIEPELTTIRQPIYEMGEQACKLLIDIIDGKTINKKIEFKPKLILRGTA
ncbi:LacI family DNA-binding transcriptional regulator [Clostridium tyrobutyricum]|uniref:LacI family DNA-binding transcriptional regulator n=1 Tax=Clostridium tyrobutyricum TaxID=1519 RepID=UPI001C38332D|nr:LacI family DNA-binding transcriptional regulator [Clostridium tyrobutyricum]MBV4427310.1 LacI family transcriptional regulator [Clostridium tyrobutyricum]MBV4430133.1 LacI family transcriptional regulator [Clostridium tyrobutyricum]MBV4442355.1 LacI family transcriptional regulator [Clostridium tyrobutyricum]